MLGRTLRTVVAELLHTQSVACSTRSAASVSATHSSCSSLYAACGAHTTLSSLGQASLSGNRLLPKLEIHKSSFASAASSFLRQNLGRGRQNVSSQPALLLQKQRQVSTSPAWRQQLEDLKRSSKRLLSAPQRTVRSAQNQLARAGGKVYDILPYQGKKLIDSYAKPGSAQKVLKLHFEAFWSVHGSKVIAAAGVVAIYFMWRGMFGLTSMFLNLSETMAEFGFLALAAAMASFFYLWLKRRWTINPDSVYRLALRRLNTDPGVLEVLGAPVVGSDVRASVSTGGGVRLRGLRPAIRTRRLQMIFPLTGADRRGLVSLEAKKRKGQYRFKLLAVDVPTATGLEQRLFLDGDTRAYDRGGVMHELRDPFLQAVALRDAYEAEDDVDDAADDAELAQQDREARAAAVEPVKAIASSQHSSAAREPAQSNSYFVDRAASQVRDAARRVWSAVVSSSGLGSAESKTQPGSPPLQAPLGSQTEAAGNARNLAAAAAAAKNEPISNGQKAASNESTAPLPASRS